MSLCLPCTRLKEVALCTDSIIIGTVASINTQYNIYFTSLANGMIVKYTATSDSVGLLTLTPADGFLLASNTGYEIKVNKTNSSLAGEALQIPAAAPICSYINSFGQGNRTALITVTTTIIAAFGTPNKLINGSLAAEYAWNQQLIAGLYLRFDFGYAIKITEVTWFQNNLNTHGTWQWQGSNDAITWTNIGNQFVLGGATTQIESSLSGNTNMYRYYQMLGISGNANSTADLSDEYEIEFKNCTSGYNSALAHLCYNVSFVHVPYQFLSQTLELE